MKHLSYIFLLGGAALLSACSQQDDAPVGGGEPRALHISNAAIGTTRANIDDRYFLQGDTIGLFISQNQSPYGQQQNIPAVFNGETWDMLQYVSMPSNTESLFVTAYYPYSPNIENVGESDEYIRLSGNLTSGNVLGSDLTHVQADGSVNLTFHHMLALITFRFSATEAAGNCAVSQCRLVASEGIRSGMTTYLGILYNLVYSVGLGSNSPKAFATSPISEVAIAKSFDVHSGQSPTTFKLTVPYWTRFPLHLEFNLDGVQKVVNLPETYYYSAYSYAYNIIIDADNEVQLTVGTTPIYSWEDGDSSNFQVK